MANFDCEGVRCQCAFCYGLVNGFVLGGVGPPPIASSDDERCLFFFFQAEDGIRDDLVTGVQTCALPISKMVGGQLQMAMDPPTIEPSAKEGLISVGDFSVKGEAALDRLAAGGPAGAQSGVAFSRLRAEFTRQNGQLTIREGVLKGPMIGGTIEGSID